MAKVKKVKPKVYNRGNSKKPKFTWKELHQAYITFWLFGFLAGIILMYVTKGAY